MARESLKNDEDWKQFAEAVRSEFSKCTFQERLIAACGGQEDIAWAAFFHHGSSALEWLEGTVPFLGKSRPCDLIKRGNGDRVRKCLWRTP